MKREYRRYSSIEISMWPSRLWRRSILFGICVGSSGNELDRSIRRPVTAPAAYNCFCRVSRDWRRQTDKERERERLLFIHRYASFVSCLITVVSEDGDVFDWYSLVSSCRETIFAKNCIHLLKVRSDEVYFRANSSLRSIKFKNKTRQGIICKNFSSIIISYYIIIIQRKFLIHFTESILIYFNIIIQHMLLP